MNETVDFERQYEEAEQSESAPKVDSSAPEANSKRAALAREYEDYRDNAKSLKVAVVGFADYLEVKLLEARQAIVKTAVERDGYLDTVNSCQPVFKAYGAACREAVAKFGHMPIDFAEWLSDYVRQHEAMKTEIEALHQPEILARRVRVLEAKLRPFALAALVERASGTPETYALVGTWTEKDIPISDTEHLCVRHLNDALEALPELKPGAANGGSEQA